MITLIDYGIGNLRSVQKALEAVGATVHRTDDPQEVRRASKLVLPGVGAFGACAAALRERGLDEALLDAVDRGAALLGLCVGMQLLFDASEEKGDHRGLGLLPGRIVRFGSDCVNGDGHRLKIPHVGWNRIEVERESPLTRGLPEEAYVYFVHSYVADVQQPDDVLARTQYGTLFPSIVGRNRVYGVQFHPEKSQSVGLHILRNFVQPFD